MRQRLKPVSPPRWRLLGSRGRNLGSSGRRRAWRVCCAFKASKVLRATFLLQSMAGSPRVSTRSTCGRQSSCWRNWRKISQSTRLRAYESRPPEYGRWRAASGARDRPEANAGHPAANGNIAVDAADLVACALAVRLRATSRRSCSMECSGFSSIIRIPFHGCYSLAALLDEVGERSCTVAGRAGVLTVAGRRDFDRGSPD